MQMPVEAQYAIAMDAPIDQLLVMVVHISAVDVVPEMKYVFEAQRHRKCNAKLLYAKSHRRKIVERLHLKME